MFEKLKHALQQLPSEVKTFLWKAVVLFIAWKLVYILLLIPNEVPDAWLVRTLGNSTAQTLNFFYTSHQFHAEPVIRQKKYGNDLVSATYSYIKTETNRSVVGIYESCNALELIILYAGFIICFRGNWKRKIVFVIAGSIALHYLNVLRCTFLGYISLEWPQHFELAHKYVFNLVVYALTFFLWMIYVKGLSKTNEKNATA